MNALRGSHWRTIWLQPCARSLAAPDCSEKSFERSRKSLYPKEFDMTAALNAGRPFTGSERDLLQNTLHLNRAEIVRAVEDLSDNQARERLVPSLTTPISLIKHCAAAERIWFQRTLAGRSIEACDGHATGGDGSFSVADDETLPEVIAEYRAACAQSNELADGCQLDDVVEHHIVGPVCLRFIYLGVIAEVARHAGRADILVEQIRAATNRTPARPGSSA
ncbi:DinB family protein [Mycobacterium sp. BMJ-28]